MGKVSGMPFDEGRIGVVPTGRQLRESDGVRSITIDLVGAHVDEGALRTALAGRLQQVQGPDRVRVEVVERDCRRPVMGRLRSGVHDDRGLQLLHERQDAGAVSHVQFVVNEASNLPLQPALVPASVALRTEEHRALVVVHTVDRVPLASEVRTDLAADQPGRSGHKHGLHCLANPFTARDPRPSRESGSPRLRPAN